MANRDIGTLAAELKLGNGLDRTVVEVTGFLRGEGGALAYRDEYPSGRWTSAGASAAPDEVNVTIGGVATRAYAFDGGTTQEYMSNNFEIPHDYAYTKDIEVHCHWSPATTGTGDVKLFFQWCFIPSQGAPVSQTALSFVSTISSNNQYYNKITSFGNLPNTNTYQLGDKILFNIYRDPTDPQDTYTGDVYVWQVALHVPLDTRGSRQIYVK